MSRCRGCGGTSCSCTITASAPLTATPTTTGYVVSLLLAPARAAGSGGANALQSSASGLYVPSELGPTLTVTDSSTVDLTASGTQGHALTAAVRISTAAGNQVQARTDGLFVPAPGSVTETALSVVDSSTIDFTASGTSSHTLTGSVKLSTTAGNAVVALTDGLYGVDAVASMPTQQSSGFFGQAAGATRTAGTATSSSIVSMTITNPSSRRRLVVVPIIQTNLSQSVAAGETAVSTTIATNYDNGSGTLAAFSSYVQTTQPIAGVTATDSMSETRLPAAAITVTYSGSVTIRAQATQTLATAKGLNSTTSGFVLLSALLLPGAV